MQGSRRGPAGMLAVLLLGAALATGTAPAGQAVTTRGIGTFGAIGGAAGAFTSTMQLPGLGYPEAQLASDLVDGRPTPGATHLVR